MSDVKAILAARLAKGEITEDDYDRLIAKIGIDPKPAQSPPSLNRHTADPLERAH